VTVAAPTGAATGGFDPTTLEAAADKAFTLTFDNQDDQAPHNVVIQDTGGTKVQMAGDTSPFTGPSQRSYSVSGLKAGDYKFICEVHPTTMTGTLTVK
jgi:plastocyanin